MFVRTLLLENATRLAYVLAFGGAAVLCFATLTRARRITDPDTRRGLQALLVTSGGWAATHVAFLVVPIPTLKLAVYQLGLIIGFSTVGAWLYFCSAYTGRTLHREPGVRRLAVAVFVVVIAVKLTNPLHHLYFETAFVTTPFPHVSITNGMLHWVVMGLAYALALVGYFMLVELFWQVGHDTTPLVGLIALTALPGVLDFIGFATPALLNITYEPLGVAAFAVGVFYLYFDVFQTIQVIGGHDAPVIVVDDDNHVRDYNAHAGELFPALTTGESVETSIPAMADSLDSDSAVLDVDRDGETRYYHLTTTPFMSGNQQVITLADVTDREQYRRKLEGQNERLDEFASMVSHDLRNPLNVASGRLALAQQGSDSEHLDAMGVALDRMETLIDNLLALARQGQPIDDTEEVRLSEIVTQCWSVVATSEASLSIEGDMTFMADRSRLRQLFENVFRNAIDHGDEEVKVSVGALSDRPGFYIADDGPGIPESAREAVFESGHTTAQDGSGFGLAIVEEIVEAHGWEIRVTEGTDGGARFEITAVVTT